MDVYVHVHTPACICFFFKHSNIEAFAECLKIKSMFCDTASSCCYCRWTGRCRCVYACLTSAADHVRSAACVARSLLLYHQSAGLESVADPQASPPDAGSSCAILRQFKDNVFLCCQAVKPEVRRQLIAVCCQAFRFVYSKSAAILLYAKRLWMLSTLQSIFCIS